ncbi:MAG TPA: YCF48-related protein [Flavipsychrobacter sp.]|nr:YCF48-related protein [Flavipsychrobacter sp.]
MIRWQQVEKLETFTDKDRFNKIFFINDSLGFVIGGQRFFNSTILKTTDGGKTWNYRNIPEAPKSLFGITTSPNGTLYIIGFDGKLLKSEDAGESWQFHQLWYLPYKDIAMFDDKDGIAVGGISFYAGYKTQLDLNGNFGAFDSVGYEINDVEMIDGNAGYLATYGAILKTNDAGKSWQMQEIENDNFTSIRAYGENEAWTCGYNGSIFHTSDGGKNWERMRDGNDLTKPRYRLLDILFQDPQHGFAVGENGLFLFTDDGGYHWMEFERFTDNTLRCIISRKDGSLMVCGDNGRLYSVKPKRF